MLILEAYHLTKAYRERGQLVSAVQDVSLQVAVGAVQAFLGRNGAGKTTSIKMMAGLILLNPRIRCGIDRRYEAIGARNCGEGCTMLLLAVEWLKLNSCRYLRSNVGYNLSVFRARRFTNFLSGFQPG
jgi:ABC-type taurine transport system ATPase subunit